VLDEARKGSADLLDALACVRNANKLLSAHELTAAQLACVRASLAAMAVRANTLAKAADRAARRQHGARP